MPTINVYDTSGKKLSKMTLPKEIFGVKPNEFLIAQAVRVYLANQRKAKPKTKSRSEVQASGRKIWRQKGTGRARHGDRKAPIFVKGGIAHGPTGEEDFKLKMSQKMRRLALFSSLSSKCKGKEMIVLDGLEKIKPKTKEMAKVIQKLKLKNQKDDSKELGKAKLKISFVLPSVIENIIRAGRNIPHVSFLQANLLNTYEVLNGGMLVFMKPSIKVLKDTFLKKNS